MVDARFCLDLASETGCRVHSEFALCARCRKIESLGPIDGSDARAIFKEMRAEVDLNSRISPSAFSRAILSHKAPGLKSTR
jgi:hypothetical protein